jgi:GntR family transcriptional repressor for pyruvate dehydrogenase complex
MLEPLSQETLTSRAADTIKRYIIAENLQPGDLLPSERQMSEVLAVSRGVLREALSLLVAEGVITKKPGRGSFVKSLTSDSATASFSLTVEGTQRFQSLREARAALEVGMMGLVVNRITEKQLCELHQLVVAMEDRQSRGETIVKEDLEFHNLLWMTAGNDVLAQLWPLVVDVIRLSVSTQPELLSRSVQGTIFDVHTHRRIYEALKKRDRYEAQEAMREHLRQPQV